MADDPEVTVIPDAVHALGDPRRPTQGWALLPPSPDVCSMCAKDHEPELPHDWQTIYWQYAFRAEYDRWPTIDDAFSHCDDEMQEIWRQALLEHGIELKSRNP